MPRKQSGSERVRRFVSLIQRFSEWRKGAAVIILIFVIALATRTVGLSSFPYFPDAWPWNGVNGLYYDEYNIGGQPLFGVYFPFLQIALMRLAILLVGYTNFGIRLVSALFSSVTSVLVYLSAYELFKKRLPAFVSSLFFVFMTPALIYGRMAFVENGAATFLTAAFLFTLKYIRTMKDRWLISSMISAGLSFLCKQTGIISAVLLVLLVIMYKPEATRHLLKYLIIGGGLFLVYIIQIALVDPAYLGSILSTYFDASVRSADWFNILLTTSMPTGHSLMWHTFPEMLWFFWNIRIDYWYALAYFVIAYLAIKERELGRPILVVFSLFILLLILLGHGNVYYVALVQPFMAIPMGYGLLRLQAMHGVAAFALSVLLCFPAITYINYYVSYFLIQNSTQVTWIVIQFTLVIPVVVLGMTRLVYDKMEQSKAIIINRFLLAFYLACLIIGSYLLPVFYPGYFAQSSVPV